MSKIYLINGGSSRPVDELITARLRDGLNSELTLSLTLTAADVPYINDSTNVLYEGQLFYISSYQKDTDGQSPICTVECEHISYILNDEEYKLEEFIMTGTPAQLLAAALAGTPFTVGVVEPSNTTEIFINDPASRRAILFTVATLAGGEIEYDGNAINIRTHRGSTSYIDLMGTDNVTHVAINRDVRERTTSYNITLGRKTILNAGDNVHIVFTPLGINANTRIIAIEYNPYNPFEVSVDVGDYVPDILESFERIDDAIKAAENAAKRVDSVASKAEDAVKKAEQAIEKAEGYDERITITENNVLGLADGLVTINGSITTISNQIVTTSTTLRTEIADAKQAAITESTNFTLQQNLSITGQINGIYTDLLNIEGEIQAVDLRLTVESKTLTQAISNAQQAAILTSTQYTADLSAKVLSKMGVTNYEVSVQSGTLVNQIADAKQAAVDLAATYTRSYTDGVVSTINTSMAAIKLTADAASAQAEMIVTNIGSSGTVNAASIVASVNSAGSSVMINANKVVLTAYSTTAQMNTAITTEIGNINLTVSSSTSNNQTTSTINLRRGTTSISNISITGTTATQAATITADAIKGITLSVTTSAANDQTSSTITMKSGTTTIDTAIVIGTTAAQATSITNSAISGLTLSVTTSTASNQTTSTITMRRGTTTITSAAVIGTTAAQVSTITADAVNGITLSVTNGSTSSTFTLKNGSSTLSSGSITFNGFVTFTNLSSVNTSTTINGGNITTGTIDANTVTIKNLSASNITTGTLSADRIDVSQLRLNRLYASNYIAVEAYNTSSLYIGGGYNNGTFTNLFLYANSYIYIGQNTDYYRLIIDTSSRILRGASSGTGSYGWSLGSSTYPYLTLYSYSLDILGGSIRLGTSGAGIGFFGVNPQSRKTLSDVSSAATLAIMIGAFNSLLGHLRSYGLLY